MSDIAPVLKNLVSFGGNPPVPVPFDAPDDIRTCDCCNGRTIAYFARHVIAKKPSGERMVILCRRCVQLATVYQKISGG